MKLPAVLLMALTITACDNENSNSQATKEKSIQLEAGEKILDAAEYFSNPSQYSDQKIYLFLREVQGPGFVPGANGFISYYMEHGVRKPISLDPSKEILNSWTTSGLDKEGFYTVTFRVKAVDISFAKKFFVFEFDKFIVNTEDGTIFDFPPKPAPITLIDGLPAERAKEPLAKIVREFEKIKLYPEEYKNQRVRTSIRLSNDDIKTYDDEHWIASKDTINVLLPKSKFRESGRTFPSVFDVNIVGQLKPTDSGYILLAEDFQLE